jgi:hypothetical protein
MTSSTAHTADVLAKLVIARRMLSNYAAFDERHGFEEDAAYTRRRLVEIDEVIAKATGAA